jgi:putative CocE/NonD family hydrolase
MSFRFHNYVVRCIRLFADTVFVRALYVLLGIALAFGIAVILHLDQYFSTFKHERLAKARNAMENELESLAVIDRKVMVPMRDGERMAADIYRPKDASQKYPVIFWRVPYDFNYWDVDNNVPNDMTAPLQAVKHGYAFVEMNERGRFFSEGTFDILGPPRTDGDDAIAWTASQPWSNGKVGTGGCSSSGEWQLGVAALGNPAFATMIPSDFGAGIGRVSPYYEQGNIYRGGALQMWIIYWLYYNQHNARPIFPHDVSQDDLVRAAKWFNLAPHMPSTDWSKALRHLPEKDIIEAAGGPHGIFADRVDVASGGAMIRRTPNDPAWYRGGLWHDDMPIHVPGLWLMSWYDLSVGPNLAAYNAVRRHADPAATEQYAVIAPTLHCEFDKATAQTLVGERDMGDARLDYDALIYGWLDHFLKGEDNKILENTPRVQYFTMGLNKWQKSDTWPPEGAQPMTLYLASGGNANTLHGDGRLDAAAPDADTADQFVYDPLNPVPSHGGNSCCIGDVITAGAFDQRKMEERADILVYTSNPMKEGVEVSGSIDAILYVSSDAKDTDFTMKVIDVYPDGTAYNLDETIQRLRYRNGYDEPLAWMEPGKVYKVVFQPMTTSNYFAAGHRIRIEISSSNFPRFDRNMNTGGNNYDEVKGLVAENAVHHSRQYPSQITLTVVKQQGRMESAANSFHDPP